MIRFLSFYDDCPPSSADDTSTDSVVTEPRNSLEEEVVTDSFESLPLVFGMCMAKLPLWGCWKDQLDIVNKRGSAAMLGVRASGALICGAAPSNNLHICNNNCSDLDPSLRGLWGKRPCGMAWMSSWLAEVKPMVHQKLVRGFFVGDELMDDGLSVDEMETICAKIKQSLGDLPHFIYTNEGYHIQYGWQTVPPSLDVISVDGYGPGRNETDSMRAIYEKHLFPKLASHQRVALVPGMVGCACASSIHDGQCSGTQNAEQRCTYDDSNTSQCQCHMNGPNTSLRGQESLLLQKLDAYWQWAQDDQRVAGICPWHWGLRVQDPPYGSTGEAQYDLGASAFPAVVRRVLEIGWRNASQLVLGCQHPSS